MVCATKKKKKKNATENRGFECVLPSKPPSVESEEEEEARARADLTRWTQSPPGLIFKNALLQQRASPVAKRVRCARRWHGALTRARALQDTASVFYFVPLARDSSLVLRETLFLRTPYIRYHAAHP